MRFLRKIFSNRFTIGAVLFVLAFSVFGTMHPAFAQLDSTNLTDVGTAGGFSTVSAPIIIARVIRVFLGTLGIIFTILVLWSGWIYMTAQGDDTKIKKAKDILKNGIIGMIICIFSYTITTYILNRILEAAGLGSTSTSVLDGYTEPLSGSLGAGIIESHYPERYALEIPRNTRIMVTFKEEIDPSTIISDYDATIPYGGTAADGVTEQSTDILPTSVLIYPTATDADPTGTGEENVLEETEVIVTFNESHTIFVFDPVELLGNAEDDTNYTVVLTDDINKVEADGDISSAFVGSYSAGYEWTFEVSTEVDLTPPYVVSVIPTSDEEDRNITVEMTFSEAMDPVVGTGTYVNGSLTDDFSNIELDDDGDSATGYVDGTYSISNGYKTIEFTPTDACGEDPCGDPIYCLPGLAAITVDAHSATVDTANAPQAYSTDGITYNGLMDAAANSLDGDNDGEVLVGRPDDDYPRWGFDTTNDIDDTVPVVESVIPGIEEENFDNETDVSIDFSVTMQSSTINSSNISFWAAPWYEMWFSVGKTDVAATTADDGYTTANISHPTLVDPDDDGVGWNYYPVITKGVKSSYQICMFPTSGLSDDEGFTPDGEPVLDCDGSGSASGTSTTAPYCCNGSASSTACETSPALDPDGDTFKLPDTEN